MARTFKRRESLSALTEINVTPLIDLAFALLIIFMITTPLLEQSIRINLPTESLHAQPAPETNVETISIDSRGRIFWGDEQVDKSRLNAKLRQASLGVEPPVISIRADESLRYQHVIDVIDLVKDNNLKRISLPTRAE